MLFNSFDMRPEGSNERRRGIAMLARLSSYPSMLFFCSLLRGNILVEIDIDQSVSNGYNKNNGTENDIVGFQGRGRVVRWLITSHRSETDKDLYRTNVSPHDNEKQRDTERKRLFVRLFFRFLLDFDPFVFVVVLLLGAFGVIG
jgi:hypothetical protein